MKLRNKKTGEIVDLSIFGITLNIRKEEQPTYHSIKGVCEDWEDYTPTEPLIKDEKKRKLIRDWAEINGIKVVSVCETFNAWGVKNIAKGEPGDKEYMLADILFRGEKPEKLEFGKEYTIPELCGEEEE